jgi:hypothetical protein
MKRINLLTSVGSSSKQMQQTSGSFSIVGDETAVDVAAVEEAAVAKVAMVDSVFFLLMVCGNCDRSIHLNQTRYVDGGTVLWILLSDRYNCSCCCCVEIISLVLTLTILSTKSSQVPDNKRVGV